jgi:hypothetical protein
LLKEAGAILVNETGESYSLGDENLFVFKNKQGFESLIDLLKRI